MNFSNLPLLLVLLLFSTATTADPDLRCGSIALAKLGAVEPVTISKVVDGDTVRLVDGRKVRFIGVNAPEMNWGHRPEPEAREAMQLVSRMLTTRRAFMMVGDEPRDDYGRILAHLFSDDGESLEAELVVKGLAWHVAIPPNIALSKCLSKLEKRARVQRLGVWRQAATPVAEVHSGGFQYLVGKVSTVTYGKTWWLSLENRVALRIPRGSQRYFNRGELSALVGETIYVKGWVYPSRSAKYEPWRINLLTPDALIQ